MNVIEIKSLTKIYNGGEIQVKAVNGIDINFKEGEFNKRPIVMHIMVLSIPGFKIRVVYGRQMAPNVTHILVLAFSHCTGYQTLCL